MATKRQTIPLFSLISFFKYKKWKIVCRMDEHDRFRLQTDDANYNCSSNRTYQSHCSVDSSAPTIMQSQVRIPNTLSTFFYLLYYICNCIDKRTKINKKETGFGPYFKSTYLPNCNCQIMFIATEHLLKTLF